MCLRVLARAVIPGLLSLLVVMLLLAGCASPGITVGATPTSGTRTPGGGAANTPTVVLVRPTGTLTIDDAFCQKILTLSEASQIMGAEAKAIPGAGWLDRIQWRRWHMQL